MPELMESRSLNFYRRLVENGKFTLFLTALCALVYLFQSLGWEKEIMLLFHYPLFWGDETEIWRYFSHSFVHLSQWHIVFNLAWWWIFGGAIEQCFGTFKLILLFLFSAVLSGVAENYVSGPLFFGLSGVVYAVLGFVFILDKFSQNTFFDLPQGFFTMLLVGIAFGFISPLIGIQIGNAAHISGLIVGIIAAFLQLKTTK